MKKDLQIAKETNKLPIWEISEKLGINRDDLLLYGNYKAKLSDKTIKELEDKKNGKLILVTAINPTPAGEGKTTMTIGLGQAFEKIGEKSIIVLREPSLGPVFGVKGGAAGGGYCQLLPMEDINLHFTGDFHAITSANNLLCAMLDNHIHQGNELNIDERTISFKRVLDLNDRTLRQTVIGLGGKTNGYPREDSFQITVASEVMAIFCLAKDLDDLQKRLGEIIVARDKDNKPVRAKDLKAEGAMTALLKDALSPNLVQTTENTPAIVHGGPFANIAHGCNSIIATKSALKLADYCITEAGFGSDLGAEKFLDIKCPAAGIAPDAICLVATIRALKYNGGVKKEDLEKENLEALEKGFVNLKRHYDNMNKYNVPVVVTINSFATDTKSESELLLKLCKEENMPCALNTSHINGGEGAIETAKILVEKIKNTDNKNFSPIYDYSSPLKEKIEKVAKEIYRAKSVVYSHKAEKKLEEYENLGYKDFPVCIAKTQYSFSDDASKLGAPEDFEIHVQDVNVSAGAGFVVCYLGDIMTMPGLPKTPQAENIRLDENKEIVGLF